MDVDYPMSDFKKKLFEAEHILRSTTTNSEYIVNADKWRIRDDYNMYKNHIDCNEVYPNIILGNIYSARYKPFLKDIGVTHVLNCAFNHCFSEKSLDQDYYNDYNIRFKGLELEDICTENIARCFDESIQFIDDAINNNGKVLVHCFAGVSRSATVTIAYLMKRHNMHLEDAIRAVKLKRSISPNEGFLKQLVELEFQLNKERNRR